jgi:hypothetical protein
MTPKAAIEGLNAIDLAGIFINEAMGWRGVRDFREPKKAWRWLLFHQI